MITSEIFERLKAMASDDEARHLRRFFKTGPGEYGEGDRFLGVRVPLTRELVKEYKKVVREEDIRTLVESEFHEVRLAGFLLLIELYKRAKRSKNEEQIRTIVDIYISYIDRGNNWDLVDMVAPKILGDYLIQHPEERTLLHQLAEMDGQLWHQRVAIVSNWTMIRAGIYDDTLQIAERFLPHRHDLIHKASGWMVREVGKHGGMDRMLEFLDRHAARMPRTMLRYAIEHLPEEQRHHYMTLKPQSRTR